MSFRRIFSAFLYCCLAIVLAGPAIRPQAPAQSSSPSSSSSRQLGKPASAANSPLDSGTVSHGVYRNAAFGFVCKIPAGWVLRTEEMNAPEEGAAPTKEGRAALDRTAEGGCPHTGGCGRVLLAAFSASGGSGRGCECLDSDCGGECGGLSGAEGCGAVFRAGH